MYLNSVTFVINEVTKFSERTGVANVEDDTKELIIWNAFPFETVLGISVVKLFIVNELPDIK